MCAEWVSDFLAFQRDMGTRPQNGTLERKDTNLGYCKDNCHWVGQKTQCQNMRVSKRWFIRGEIFQSLSEATKRHNKPSSTIIAWCDGYTRKSKFYPAKPNCWSEKKYGEVAT